MKYTLVRIDARLRDRIKMYAEIDGRTMEWCITTAIEQFMSGTGPVSEEVEAVTEDKTTIAQSTILERACCILAKPCQHWVFNPDVGWRNSLSWRIKDADY